MWGGGGGRKKQERESVCMCVRVCVFNTAKGAGIIDTVFHRINSQTFSSPYGNINLLPLSVFFWLLSFLFLAMGSYSKTDHFIVTTWKKYLALQGGIQFMKSPRAEA